MSAEEKRAFWNDHIHAWQQSALSQRAYCQQHNLSLAQFGYWRKRVAGSACSAKERKLIALELAPAQALIRVRLARGIELEVPVSTLDEVLPALTRFAQGPI